MVLSYYLYRFPYHCIWRVLRCLGKNPRVVVYCAEPLDHVVLQPILKHLPPLPLIAKNHRTQRYLEKLGYCSGRLPSFPLAVITCRHAAHKFPEKAIVKIGFRHGAYHFKAFANPRAYRAFTVYGVTSRAEVEQLRQLGVDNAEAIGFPKLDPLFDGSMTPDVLDAYQRRWGIDRQRPIVLFSATWDRSGLSAIDRWIDQLQQLSSRYHILVTVHPWTSKKYLVRLKNMRYIYLLKESEVLPALAIANVMVGDSSSIIAEFCALDKPIILFPVAAAKRQVPEVQDLLKQISVQVQAAEELDAAIARSLRYPQAQSVARRQVARIMFDQLDGRAGRRAAELVKRVLKEKNIMLEE